MGKKQLTEEQKQHQAWQKVCLKNVNQFTKHKIKWFGNKDFRRETADGPWVIFYVSGSPDDLLARRKTYDCFEDHLVVDSIGSAKSFLRYNPSVSHAILFNMETSEVEKEVSRSYGPGHTEPNSWNNWIKRSKFALSDD